MAKSLELISCKYQPKHNDIEVAADRITRWIDEELFSRRDIKRNERLRYLLRHFKNDLKFCMSQELKKHHKIQFLERKHQEKNLHKLLVYEANQIRLCNWLFEESDIVLRPLTARLKEVKCKFEDEKVETVQRTSLAYKEAGKWKLSCLKEQNQKVLEYLRRDWQRKLEDTQFGLELTRRGEGRVGNIDFIFHDSWKRIENQIKSMHDQEVEEKSKRAEKSLEGVLNARQSLLQPKLDLLRNKKRVVCEHNQHLEEKIEAIKTKQSTALDLLVKLKTSFKYFVVEMKQISTVEAKQIVAESISRNSDMQK